MATLIFYGILLAALVGGYTFWHHSISAEGEKRGAAEQFKADKPILDACDRHGNAEPAKCAQFLEAVLEQEAQREIELKACTNAAQNQNAAIDRIVTQTAQALAQSQALKAKQATTQKEFETRQAQLAAIAGQHETTTRECKDELARVNTMLDSYRPRRVQ